jgi:hypothetical protein
MSTETPDRVELLHRVLEQERRRIKRLESAIVDLRALCTEAAAAIERGYHDGDTPALVARLRGEPNP